ncbi:MAG TPA: CDP-alcohol phosphatidyltransferase family protein [archaeon]|nr:CDP-alcohol phosphatidyltransferase family protein [archaeon]
MQNKFSIYGYLKLADLITIFSLLSGFIAIIFFSQKEFSLGMIALVFAAFFDWADGKAARLQGKGTAFGKALDISDLLSFGAAPALFIAQVLPNYFGYAAAGIFLTASLLRLARFQITETNFSIGMPTTVNGLIFPAIYFLQNYFGFNEYFYAAVTLVSSAMMLSSFEIKKII